MDLRFSTLAALTLALFLDPLHSQTPPPLKYTETNWYAIVQVQVRDSNGHPVTGLEPRNFVINENGTTDPIVSVENFEQLTSAPGPPQPQIRDRQPTWQPYPAQAPQPTPQTARPTTWVLIILAPMSATGRNASITGIQKFLNQPHPADWSFALFDDAGELTSFSKDIGALQSRLRVLDHHPSPPQFDDGTWAPLATRAIAELGLKPGRRAVVFASDFAFDVADKIARHPRLLRASPSWFIDAARSAQSPMYTFQASGPGVATPFGDAASSELPDVMGPMTFPLAPGELAALQINSSLVGLGAAFADFAWSAYQTGGRSARTCRKLLNTLQKMLPASTASASARRFVRRMGVGTPSRFRYALPVSVPDIEVSMSRPPLKVDSRFPPQSMRR